MIKDNDLQAIKLALSQYLTTLDCTPNRQNRCRCPVHKGEHNTTAWLETQTGKIHGIPTLLHCPVCDKTWDIVALHAELTGLDCKRDFTRICQDLCHLLGLRIEIEPEKRAPKASHVAIDAPAQAPDYSEYIGQCANNLAGAADYLQSRGISLETARRYGLGYDDKTKRLIIPIGNGYQARATFPCEKDYRYRKSTGLKSQGFALDTLTKGGFIWICEGEIDVLSIIEAGHKAVGLSGTSGVDGFCRYLGEYMASGEAPAMRFILALDPDEGGQKAQTKLADWMKAQGLSFCIAPGFVKAKDANDALTKHGKDAFKAWMDDIEGNFKDEKDIERENYLQSCVAYSLHEHYLKAQNAEPAIKTGVYSLDEVLGGGLRPGLHVIGAIPALGKTALILQIACYISASGQDVLYFSLEMPKDDLVWRSISRLTYTQDKENAATQRELQFSPLAKLSESKQQNALKAYETFYNQSQHFWIIEGIGAIGVDDIEARVSNHKTLTGNSPVVVIDYLQILKPADPRMTDKAALDYNAMRLKQISNTFKTPMMIISSFNRANYSSEAGFESFKESGAIEYCSDVLIGLQLKAAIDAKRETKGDATQAVKDATRKAKADETREIELVLLKNRAGGLTGDRGLFLNFTPRFNHFSESPIF